MSEFPDNISDISFIHDERVNKMKKLLVKASKRIKNLRS